MNPPPTALRLLDELTRILAGQGVLAVLALLMSPGLPPAFAVFFMLAFLLGVFRPWWALSAMAFLGPLSLLGPGYTFRLQDQQITAALAPRERVCKLSDRDQEAALQLLMDPNLVQRIAADFDACGVVGEETYKLAGYLAATSRKLDKPLAVMIQSSSSAGKTSLMDAVLPLMPPRSKSSIRP